MVEKKSNPKRELVHYFERNGYLRMPNDERIENEGHQKYKKGYEIRFVPKTEEEQEEIFGLLQKCSFKAGKVFQKSRQSVIPVYGRKSMDRFQQLLTKYSKGY
jgi:hypothetical protein